MWISEARSWNVCWQAFGLGCPYAQVSPSLLVAAPSPRVRPEKEVSLAFTARRRCRFSSPEPAAVAIAVAPPWTGIKPPRFAGPFWFFRFFFLADLLFRLDEIANVRSFRSINERFRSLVSVSGRSSNRFFFFYLFSARDLSANTFLTN